MISFYNLFYLNMILLKRSIQKSRFYYFICQFPSQSVMNYLLFCLSFRFIHLLKTKKNHFFFFFLKKLIFAHFFFEFFFFSLDVNLENYPRFSRNLPANLNLTPDMWPTGTFQCYVLARRFFFRHLSIFLCQLLCQQKNSIVVNQE